MAKKIVTLAVDSRMWIEFALNLVQLHLNIFVYGEHLSVSP